MVTELQQNLSPSCTPSQQSDKWFPQCPDAVIKTFCKEQAPQRERERIHGTSQGTS